MEKKIKQLEYAKQAVKACLANSMTAVDMHGLVYWAEQVEKIRQEIKESL